MEPIFALTILTGDMRNVQHTGHVDVTNVKKWWYRQKRECLPHGYMVSSLAQELLD